LANDVVDLDVGTPEQAVVMLMQSGHPWMKLWAAYASGPLGLKSLESEVDAWKD